MTQPRRIAVVHEYDDLLRALRARVDELAISRVTIDHVSGLPSGYASKLLCDPPIKGIGKISLGPMLGALGLAIHLVEDLDAMKRIAERLVPRDQSQVRHTKPLRIRMEEEFKAAYHRANGSKGGRARIANSTAEQRSASARKAVMARWAAVRKARKLARNAPSPHPASASL